MKDLLNVISVAILLVPCLIIFSEGGSLLWNMAGIAYLLALVGLSRTKAGKRFTRNAYRANLRLHRNFFNY